MGLTNFILTCEKDNEELRKDINYYKNMVSRLKKENQELNDKISNIKESYETDAEAKFYDYLGKYNSKKLLTANDYVELNKNNEILMSYNQTLLKENQGLKKQLENCYCNRTDCSGRIKDSKVYDSLVQKVETQQKEFIKYLEDMLDDENDIFSVVRIKDALQKYKEIIGVSNDY